MLEEIMIELCVFFSSFEMMYCSLHPFRRCGRVRLAAGGLMFIGIPLLWRVLHNKQGSFFFAPFFQLGSWFYWGYLLFFILSLALMCTSFEIDIWHALFYGSAAYIVQHLRFGLVELAAHLFYQGERSSLEANLISAVCTVVLYCLNWFLLVRQVKKREDVMVDNRQLIVFACLAIVMVNVINLYLSEYQLRSGAVCLYVVVVCLLLLVIQFGMFERRKILSDKQIVESLLTSVDKQRKYSEENIELINRKCHDLKHQIAAMRNMTEKQRSSSIDELEKAVMFYDCNYHTGNATLDAMLTEKSLLCEQRGIEFTCIVDGKGLEFMEPADLYSLLGNALDNAIEAVSAETEKDRRMITLNIARNSQLISICLINVCTRELEFENGFPVTVKKDKNSHGFGTKSMAYIAEKYGGSLQMIQKADTFEVDILIPL